MNRFLLLSLLAIALPSLAEEEVKKGVTVKVTVTNIPGAKGDLLIGLYDSEESFTKESLPGSPKIELTTEGDVEAEIVDVKPGTYAIAVIQDLNQNGKLDKNFLGIPKEPLAFSVIEKIPKGKPKFEDCSFEVGEVDVELTIPLVLD